MWQRSEADAIVGANMIQMNISLKFLALAFGMLAASTANAHYPYGQQQYYANQQPPQNNQNYYPQAANNNGYSNNNINNVAYNIVHRSNGNNNEINNDNYNKNNNIEEYVKSSRRNSNKGNPLLTINLPKIYLGDFEYVPTPNGYRFSYDRTDGSRFTEVGVIPGVENTGIYAKDESVQVERNALRARGRENSKNRKLSPKALQSLAG